ALESSMEPDMTTSPSPAQPTARSRRAARAAARTARGAASSGGAGQTFWRTLASEWVKLRTLRSTWITAFIAVLLTSGFGAAIVVGMNDLDHPQAWTNVVGGIQFGQIVVAVLGALAITGEYSSGQIRSSLAAVPRRSRLLLAKATVLSLFSFVLGALSILIAWAASALFAGEAAGSLADPAYLGFVWGTGLTYAGTALLAMGLGFLMRSTAGAITMVLTLLFIIDIPINIASLKWEWVAKLQTFEPLTLSRAVFDPLEAVVQWGEPDTLLFIEHWQAALGFALWALVPMVLAAVVFSRRDA
ncbi:ABC transporter permease subunit, partial [Actinomyces sp. 187325]|uniref:ABC transporter permease subunit n=1 Tax=Actinomyces sp. 187325 TaxID=2927828 RepID=UPI0020171B96